MYSVYYFCVLQVCPLSFFSFFFFFSIILYLPLNLRPQNWNLYIISYNFPINLLCLFYIPSFYILSYISSINLLYLSYIFFFIYTFLFIYSSYISSINLLYIFYIFLLSYIYSSYPLPLVDNICPIPVEDDTCFKRVFSIWSWEIQFLLIKIQNFVPHKSELLLHSSYN